MKRLTVKAPSGLIHLIDNTEYDMYKAVNLLSAYEDTGFTPQEITDGKMLTGWIPVSERLPEYDGIYLACFDDEFVTAVRCITDRHGNQDWELWADSGEVVAWMSLPEPYKPE